MYQIEEFLGTPGHLVLQTCKNGKSEAGEMTSKRVQGLSDSFNFYVLIPHNSLTDHICGSFGINCVLKLKTNQSHCACFVEVGIDENSCNLDDMI